ncbi:hypothetical protein ACWGQT_05270 [Streptomyces yangpuensis]|uniref:Uncharacterized protein n=1 Tax=Streptomyces yangpuensis TaxID=1648182 RepID=A0ABY5PQ36_9ACTN|nr:hypothetical protein [Streptomyces yangpuensis]UUY45898.1 hypothetical protein NRK68_00915 [Streptomyces yangpuensis]
MTLERAGTGPADTTADTGDRATPWGDFRRVLDQMRGLLEGVHPDDGAEAPETAPRGAAVAGGGLR